MGVGNEIAAGPAGYSGTPLVKKLGIKAGFCLKLVNAPPHYFSLLGELPDGISISERGHFDFIHFFTKDEDELFSQLPLLKDQLKANGMIWVSWPKKSAKVSCNIAEDTIRTFGIKIGLVDIKVCAVDETWSGLKMVIQVKNR
jgi:hypothetical protein